MAKQAWESELDAALKKTPATPAASSWEAELDAALTKKRQARTANSPIVQSYQSQRQAQIAAADTPASAGVADDSYLRAQIKKKNLANPQESAQIEKQLKARQEKKAKQKSRSAPAVLGSALKTASYAGSLAPSALSLKAQGKPVTVKEVAKKAWEDQTSYGEVLNVVNPKGAGDLVQASQGLAMDLVFDPFNAFAVPGVNRVARGLVGKVTKPIKSLPLVKNNALLGAEGRAERAAIQSINAVGSRVEKNVAKTAKEIAKTQEAAKTVNSAPVKLSGDVATANSEVKAARESERKAERIVSRIQKNQRLGVQPTADLRTKRAKLEQTSKALRVHEKTEVATRLGAKKTADKGASLLSEAAKLESQANALLSDPQIRILRNQSTLADSNIASQAKKKLTSIESKAEELRLRAKDARRSGQSLSDKGKLEYQIITKSWEDQRNLLRLARNKAQTEYDESVELARSAKSVKATPIPVARANQILSSKTAARATAETNLDNLKKAIKSEGRVPLSRRGVAYALPNPGEKVTESDVRNLIGTLAERGSVSGFALTPMDAERELLGIAAELGLDIGKLQQAASQARTMGRLYKDRIVKAGVKSLDELERIEREGGYLRRVYGRHLTQEEHLDWLRRNGMEDEAARLVNAEMNRPVMLSASGRSPVKMWNPRANLSVEAQKALRPITDVIARLQAQRTATARILPRMEMLQRLSQNPNLVSDTKRFGWLRLDSSQVVERAQRMRDFGHEELAQELLAQAQQGGWGALTGKYVHPQVYYALNPQSVNFAKGWKELPGQFAGWAQSMMAPVLAREPVNMRGLGGVYNRGLSLGKALVTTRNPVSQGFNGAGNMVQMHTFGGIPAPLVPAYYTYGLEEATRGSEWAYQTLKRMPSMAEVGSLADIQQTINALQAINSTDRNVALKAAKWLNDSPDRVWQLNEVSAKLGLVKYHTQLGKSLDDAIELAELAIYDYNDVPRWIEAMRRSVIAPFPTYAYKTLGRFMDTLLFHPYRLNVYTRARQAVESVTSEEQRALEAQAMRPDEANNLPVRLPGEDQYGRAPYLRTGRFLPWGALNTDIVSGRSPFLFGPALNAIKNEDDFGRPIANPEASGVEQSVEKGKYLARSYVPVVGTWMDIANSRRTDATLQQLPEGAEGRISLPPTPIQKITRTGTVDVPRALRSQMYDLKESQKNLQKQARNHALQRGYIQNGRVLSPEQWPDSDPERRRILVRVLELQMEAQRIAGLNEQFRASAPSNTNSR